MLADVWTVIRTEYLDSFHSGDGLERVGVIVVAPVAGSALFSAVGAGLVFVRPLGRAFRVVPGCYPVALATLDFVLRERSRHQYGGSNGEATCPETRSSSA